MSDKAKIRPDLRKQVEQALKRTGGVDSNFLHALKFHLINLRDSNTEDEIETREEMFKLLFSKMFLDKMDLYPTQPFECQIDENSDWPLMPLPSECFGDEKQSDEERLKWFYVSLKIGDALDCRVSGTLQASYQLRVIHKYGVARILDDLQIMVELLHEKNEIQILERPLLVCELVRVAVSKIDKLRDKVMIYVTVDSENIASFRPIPRLGRITEKDEPSYVLEPPDTEKFSCYSDYLNSKPQFQNPHFYDEIFEGCGIDPKIVCSYFPKYNRKECIEGQLGQSLLKESKIDDGTLLAKAALQNYQKKKYVESLKYIENALNICPEKDSLKSKLYDIRSDVHSEQAKPSVSFKSLFDLELAFKLTPENDEIKQKFIHRVFKAANAYYKEKKYKNAVVGYEFILKNTENHRLAAKALNRIKTRHADKLLNLEAQSLIDLQEKKKELLSELKKMK